MREGNYFQNITIWRLEGAKLSEELSLTLATLVFFFFRSFFSSSPPKTLVCLPFIFCFWETRSWAYVCSGRKTPLIRCHVVLEAVTCQGSSRYSSVTTSLFSVCLCSSIHIFAVQARPEQQRGQSSRWPWLSNTTTYKDGFRGFWSLGQDVQSQQLSFSWAARERQRGSFTTNCLRKRKANQLRMCQGTCMK